MYVTLYLCLYMYIILSFLSMLYTDGPKGVHGRGSEMGLGQGQNYDPLHCTTILIY